MKNLPDLNTYAVVNLDVGGHGYAHNVNDVERIALLEIWSITETSIDLHFEEELAKWIFG